MMRLIPKRLAERITAPSIPTRPGSLVTLGGQQYVVMAISSSLDGSASIDLLKRSVWEARYRLQ